MKFKEYYFSLPQDEREKYARRCRTTEAYIRVHLTAEPPRKTPRPNLMLALAEQSRGQVTYGEITRHFFDHLKRDH